MQHPMENVFACPVVGISNRILTDAPPGQKAGMEDLRSSEEDTATAEI